MESNRSLVFIALLLSVFSFGVIGYELIEDWDFLDSLYMTVITLTTTGYGEVHKLSDEGRVFTIFLMLFGIGTFAYIIREFVSSQFEEIEKRRRKKMLKEVARLRGHAIICGYGRMGKVICEELSLKGFPFVVIEQKPECIEQLRQTNYLWVEGDAAEDDILIEVCVERANVLVSAIDSDADSLYVLLAARNINPEIYTVIRASSETARNRMVRMGANRVVQPLTMSGKKVAQSVINPAVEEIMEIGGLTDGTESGVQVVDITVKSGSPLEGKALVNSGLKKGDHGFVVIGIRRGNDEFIFAPKGDEIFRVDDCVVGIVKRDDYKETLKLFEA